MNTIIKVLIIDDETLARKRVVNLLNEIKGIELIGECDSGMDAVESIILNRPNLIFLDVQMKDMTGFDMLKLIDPSIMPLIIFITAFDEFALKAFDFFAFDYLLKPFKDERFFQSINKVTELFFSNKSTELNKKLSDLLSNIENPNNDTGSIKQNRLAIKQNRKILFIKKPKINYIQASSYYAEIYVENKKYLIRESLNSLLNQLTSFNFFRIHRSTIVNISFIKEVIYSNYGEIDVKMFDGKLFRVSKTHKKKFQKKMGI